MLVWMYRVLLVQYILKLGVHKALQISQVSTPLTRYRKLLAHFHKFQIDSNELSQ